MNQNPLISVVLPVYNCSLYIQDAISSILNQTIQDFELIIIDDCSIDNTVKIVQSIGDSRIKLILKEQNKGLIDSLNIGFKEAQGKYIARMDGDDISLPDRFKKQLEILENNSEIQVCGCWLQKFGSSNEIIKHKEFHDDIKTQLLLGNSMSLGSVMLIRKVFQNFFFDISKVHVEDYDFWARTAFNYNFYNIQEVFYLYRVHQEQVSSVFNETQKQKDITIKLALFHKLNYDKNVFNDELIKKVIFTNDKIEIVDCILFFKWLNALVKVNEIQYIYGQKALLEVIDIIKRKFTFDVFFSNNRNKMNYNLRIKIFKILPVNEKVFVVKNKMRERLKFLLKIFCI